MTSPCQACPSQEKSPITCLEWLCWLCLDSARASQWHDECQAASPIVDCILLQAKSKKRKAGPVVDEQVRLDQKVRD